MSGPGRRLQLIGAALSLLGAVYFYLWWEIVHRGVFQYARSIYPMDDADEWRYTACSRLVAHGYDLFSQVFSAQPPLLFLSLSAAMQGIEDSIAGARWAEISFGMIALLCSVWIVWLMAGPLPAAASALFLALSPGFLVYSHTVEAEGPMMALTTLALALAVTYARSGTPYLPLLAGLALAAAILMKLFAVWALAPLLWLMLMRSATLRAKLFATVSVLLGALVPVALDFALIHPSQQWDQVIALHQRAADLDLPGTIPPGRLLGQFLALDLGLTLVAAAGLLALFMLGRWKAGLFLVLWLPGGLLMLFLFRPLFPHHPAILLTALGTCAGVAVGLGLDEMRTRRLVVILPVGLALAAYVALGPRIVHADRHLLVPGTRAGVNDLSSYVRRHSSLSDFVATDDLAVADRAHRLVPPPLCDPSNVRLRAGYLTADDLIGSTTHYRARLVLPSFGIYRQVPRYIAWLRRHYRPVPAPEDVTAFVRR